MAENMYPKCGKCGEGILLPFFNGNGANIYVCTKCNIVFGCKDSWGHIYTKDDTNNHVRYFS